MTNDEINQKFAEKVARGIFRPVIRHITGADPEERLAEAVALTFELYAKCGFRPSRSAIPADADHPFQQGDHPGRDAAG